MRTALDQRFGVDNADFTNSTIGPTFGAQIAYTAVIAIIASLALISIYIGFRFQFKFAVPVLIALAHDLLITTGVYALFGREVTTATVAALLTILGYSLYDTIIVFDRIRENVPRMPRATFSQIVNRSMSEVLTRSLATSFSTLLPVVALMLFGGETLRDFGFALLVGIASGTYSSIFIAAPVLTAWKEREPVYRRRHDVMAREHGGVVPAFAPGRGADGDGDETPRERPARRERVPVGATAGGRPAGGGNSQRGNGVGRDTGSGVPEAGNGTPDARDVPEAGLGEVDRSREPEPTSGDERAADGRGARASRRRKRHGRR